MAEPYVPIASHTTYAALMTDLEVTTDAAETNANDLDTAVDAALVARNSADAAIASKFALFFLAGG